MKDAELFRHLRHSLDDVHMRADLDRIAARGRSLRRRRAAAPMASALAVAASLALVQPLAGRSDPADVDFHHAAWSVDSDRDTVRVAVRELREPELLTDVLARAGIRARVQFVRAPAGRVLMYCADPAGEARVPPGGIFDIEEPVVNREVVFLIRRGEIPAGAALKFVILEQTNGRRLTRMTVVRGEPAACTPESLPLPRRAPAPSPSAS